MKNLKYVFLAASMLISGGLVAETKAQAAKRKAAATKLKEHDKKHQAKRSKTEHTSYTKKPEKPVTHHKAATKTTKAVAHPATAAKSQEKSYVNQLTDALGFTGGATTAAATTAATGAIQHRGPEGFYEHHKIPYHWKHGWTGGYYNGEWQFAGHNLQWWHENYPSYYKSVVRPEATKAGVARQHFTHEAQ